MTSALHHDWQRIFNQLPYFVQIFQISISSATTGKNFMQIAHANCYAIAMGQIKRTEVHKAVTRCQVMALLNLALYLPASFKTSLIYCYYY